MPEAWTEHPHGRRHGRCGGEMGARCMVRLRIPAIRGRAWFHWGMERGKSCLGNARIWEIPVRPVREMPDCRNPVAFKSVWLRIAAILPFPKVFGSGLPQSCRFQKCLAPDCCNPVVSRSVWLRIAAILPFPEEFGSGLQQSCRFQKCMAPDCRNPAVFHFGTVRIWGNPRKNLPEMAGALKKALPLGCRQEEFAGFPFRKT